MSVADTEEQKAQRAEVCRQLRVWADIQQDLLADMIHCNKKGERDRAHILEQAW